MVTRVGSIYILGDPVVRLKNTPGRGLVGEVGEGGGRTRRRMRQGACLTC